MSARANKSHATHERWLISYADFITLLFAFFVVLYAASKEDEKKRMMAAESIDSAFSALGIFAQSTRHATKGTPNTGAEKSVVPINIVMGEDLLSPAQVKEDLERMQRELEQTLSNQVATHTVSIHMGKDGLVISLREAGFFASGSADPKAETLATLRKLSAALDKTSYNLRIEGHTDNIPIHTPAFYSNWELSSARATRITRIFLDFKALPPERISAAGYAEFHPVASNDTPDGRAENRRVDLVVLPRTKLDFSLPTPAHSSQAWHKITDRQ